VQYSNTGTVAMPAPLLSVTGIQNNRQAAIMTLDRSRAGIGFWTADLPEGFDNTILILASGQTPGVLQPGEAVQVPIYYDGWQQPWDLSYPPVHFTLSSIDAGNSTPIDWASLKDALRPASTRADAWDAIYANFVSEVGGTGGSLVSSLDAAAS